MKKKLGLAGFIAIFQFVLVLAHGFLYGTWIYFHKTAGPAAAAGGAALAILSVSFLAASLLAFRYSNRLVRWFYTVAAVWLGAVNFLFLAACCCWVIYGAARVAGAPIDKEFLAGVAGALALLVSAYSVGNAAWTRVKRITVKLPNLPEAWSGRQAVLVTDMHLGHVRNAGFARRIVRMIAPLQADAVFIAGDLYDGTRADIERLAEAWRALSVPQGIYFVAGNHEEFGDHTKYLQAVGHAGVRVLNNETVVVDGLQIVGVHYRDATHAEHFKKTLRAAGLQCERASILLTHAPDQLQVSAEAGISLQLSGHTHRGQFFPFTEMVKRMYGRFAYGLNQCGPMLVYTSCGAGTWGPPLRLGSIPEIVLIRFA